MPPKITQNIDIITRFKTFSKGFTAVMGKNMQQFNDMTTASGNLNRRTKGMNNTGAIAAHRFRTMTHGARGFKMELLGIMFFGMMIQRVFFGLLKTSMEWVGVMEVMSIALGILFLPVALQLLDWAILFLDWVGKLTEEQKTWLGWTVLLAGALGGLLFILGSVGLGIGSLLVGIGEMSAMFGASKASATGLITKIGLLRVAMVGIAIGASITIAWLGFKFLREGIEEGILIKELMGILGLGLAGAGIGLTFAGPIGAAIGFALGVSIGLLIDWYIKKSGGLESDASQIRRRLEESGAPIEDINRIVEESMRIHEPSFFGLRLPRIGSFGGTSGGETGAGGGTSINTVYNVNVSDKAEFESMLRQNNTELTESVRRSIGG